MVNWASPSLLWEHKNHQVSIIKVEFVYTVLGKGNAGCRPMTMGLKIHRMLKDEQKDPPELVEEAKKRKEVSDSILETIYNKLTLRNRSRTKVSDIDEDDNDCY